MLSTTFVLFLIFYYSRSLLCVSRANQRSILSTSYPKVLQIPPPPILLKTTTMSATVHLTYGQDREEHERLHTKLGLSNYSKHKSLFAMMSLPLRKKIKRAVLNDNQLISISN